MKGDFSRQGFDPHRHFSRVLMQQGRVLLDADWNAQTSMLLHYLRSAIADFSGPVVSINGAFRIQPRVDAAGSEIPNDFLIAPGHLYIDGALCENDEPTAYRAQPDLPVDPDVVFTGPHLVFVDVWERHVTYVQDDRIREVALGGPDTTTRARITWQVKVFDLDGFQIRTCGEVANVWPTLVEQWQSLRRGSLKAETRAPSGFAADDPCITAPGARYRGLSNRLYRVEVHRGGTAGEGATFKWSRENGSIVFPIVTVTGNQATVERLGAGDLQTLTPGTWVELIDDHDELLGVPGQLAVVEAVDGIDGVVELSPASGSLTQYDEHATTHPLLRRWDYRHQSDQDAAQASDGALLVKENAWISLEDGIHAWFDIAPVDQSNTEPHRYRTGDYWLIPARTATGDIEWPKLSDGLPRAVGPHGVEHHYAPLAIYADGTLTDCVPARP